MFDLARCLPAWLQLEHGFPCGAGVAEHRPIGDRVWTNSCAEPADQLGRVSMDSFGIWRSGGEHHPGGLRQQLHRSRRRPDCRQVERTRAARISTKSAASIALLAVVSA